MKLRFLALASTAVALSACEKAKTIAQQASKAVEEKVAAKVGSTSSSEADPELMKLVDQTAEGVLFRKDLPFPQRVEVHIRRIDDLSVRMMQSSEIGRQSGMIKGTREQVFKLERAGDHVRITEERSEFSVPSVEDPKESKKTTNPLERVAPSNKPVNFRLSGGKWRVENGGDFRSAVLEKELSPVFGQLLIEHALAPRSLWFGKRRMKPGDSLVVSGEQLPMLLVVGKGTFNLTYESIDSVSGHPCGVFSVTGDFSRKKFPDLEGNLSDEDVTIQSGKIWLSLLYPLVLKEDLDTIQSFKSGGQGNLVGKAQGTVKHRVTREWKKL